MMVLILTIDFRAVWKDFLIWWGKNWFQDASAAASQAKNKLMERQEKLEVTSVLVSMVGHIRLLGK